MKVKLKRSDLVDLVIQLKELSQSSDVYDKRFKFAIHRNLEYFDSEIKSINETRGNDANFEEYYQKRMALGRQLSDKDEKGEPILIYDNGNELYKITEHRDEANKKITELNEEYKEVIDLQEEAMKEFNEVMKEETEVDVCKISFEYLPENADYSALIYIIKETPEEIEEKYLA